MKKLNQRKIRWICREIEKEELSVWYIAKVQKITPQHARRVYAKYRGIKKPKLLPCGRKPKPISQEEIDMIMAIRKEHPYGAVNLEKIIDRQGIHIPHGRIHRVLKEQGLAKIESKKSRRRKWIRYERRHSNSLWHTDWFELEGKDTIALLDDASRLVPCVMQFDSATAENAVTALNTATERWNIPKQLITDHGTQFTSLPRETCEKPEPNIFQKRLEELGIQHIKARVKHPQSNGKLERFVQTIRFLTKHFGTLEKALEYYNFRRPHMSLENVNLRTPYQAFLDKWSKNEKEIKLQREH
ncbi:MAG: transposase [Thaumarchaeota archaeon]|nr:transposase [Nitrososphaerota archaeon]